MRRLLEDLSLVSEQLIMGLLSVASVKGGSAVAVVTISAARHLALIHDYQLYSLFMLRSGLSQSH
jgi:hypothetical protein